jgi:CHAD domain-containing protein
MPDGKWISDLKADMPLAEAARQVLRVRLQVVRDYLPRAALEADRDVEYVHQLRVGTRRADAALRIFHDCLPGKVYRKARRVLRQVRRAAGAARDWDVFLDDVQASAREAADKYRPGLDFLIGYAMGQRAAAHADLEAVYHEQGPDFDTFVADTADAARPPRGEPVSLTLLDLARPLLSGLLHDLAVAAAGDLTDYAQLHQVRIAGKRLRYAMEVFADCFAPEFRDTLYPRVEQLQELLGRANDSHVAAGRLSALRGRLRRTATWPRLRPSIERLLRSHQRRLGQERRRFHKWWEDWYPAGTEAVMTALPAPVPDDLTD